MAANTARTCATVAADTGLAGTFACGVVARAADPEHAAGIFDCGLLRQLGDGAMHHVNSRAKKADAFFGRAFSDLSCQVCASSSRMRHCSAVMGLPLPWEAGFLAGKASMTLDTRVIHPTRAAPSVTK